jgi:type IV secretory pathway TraG/TraD family ATPase VirD4
MGKACASSCKACPSSAPPARICSTVDYDPEHGGSTGPAYAAILEQCLAETLSRTERKGSVYLLADNLCALPKMGLLKEALLFGREKGLHVIASLTDASTPEALYGEADAYAILNAFGTVAAFRLQDEASRAFVQSRYGSQRVTESNVPQQGQGQQRGGVEQVSDQPVIGDDDLTGLQTGQSVVCSLHYPPFLFRVRLFGANPENA